MSTIYYCPSCLKVSKGDRPCDTRCEKCRIIDEIMDKGRYYIACDIARIYKNEDFDTESKIRNLLMMMFDV